MGSYNWGDNGFGACNPGLGSDFVSPTGSYEDAPACAQALSGWVDVKPWTIYEATCSCHDLYDGPYPLISLYPNAGLFKDEIYPIQSDFVYPGFVVSGQAWSYKYRNSSTLPYNSSDLGTTIKPGASWYTNGIAWQGSDIDSDAATESTLDFGDWSGDYSQMYSQAGTAHMAFGNPDPFSSKSAQYAMACVDAGVWHGTNYGAYGARMPSPLARQTESTDPVTGYMKSPELTYNPNPGERNHVIEHADGKHIRLHRRITLQEGEKRKVVMEYPKGFERGPNRITFAAEYVTPDMSAPTQEHFDLTKIHQKARYKKNKAIFTVQPRKLALTTMLNAQLKLVKSD